MKYIFFHISFCGLILFIAPIYSKDNQPQTSSATQNPSKEENINKNAFFIVDDFEDSSKYNQCGGTTNVYQMAPSRIIMSTDEVKRDDTETTVLKLKFYRTSEGGPYGKGGWCGYYTSLKDFKTPDNPYFNARDYSYLTMWVKGENGSENFNVGIADKHWDKAGDSVKSKDIVYYLPEHKITEEWQQARIPLNEFLLDISKISSISIGFDLSCFPEGHGEGTVYIDDIAFE